MEIDLQSMGLCTLGQAPSSWDVYTRLAESRERTISPAPKAEAQHSVVTKSPQEMEIEQAAQLYNWISDPIAAWHVMLFVQQPVRYMADNYYYYQNELKTAQDKANYQNTLRNWHSSHIQDQVTVNNSISAMLQNNRGLAYEWVGLFFPEHGETVHALDMHLFPAQFLQSSASHYKSQAGTNPTYAEEYRQTINQWVEKHKPDILQQVPEAQAIDWVQAFRVEDIEAFGLAAVDTAAKQKQARILGILLLAGIGIFAVTAAAKPRKKVKKK